MNAAIQNVCCDALGIAAGASARDFLVRNSQQPKGAPAWTITDDVLLFRCLEDPDEYNVVRNRDSPTTIIREATAQRMSPADYAAKKYDFAGKEAAKRAEEQKKHDDFVARMRTKGYTDRQIKVLVDWWMDNRKAS
jgi:tRNA(Ser,Leu) C12 N-acetylase TAN1